MMSNEGGGGAYEPDRAYELNIEDLSGPVDWASALREFEEYTPPEPQPEREPTSPPVSEEKPPPVETPKPVAEEVAAPIEEAEPEDMLGEMTGVLTEVNRAINLLRKFEQAHPYLIAPNIFRVWEDGLRETSLMMTREYHRLREDDTDGF